MSESDSLDQKSPLETEGAKRFVIIAGTPISIANIIAILNHEEDWEADLTESERRLLQMQGDFQWDGSHSRIDKKALRLKKEEKKNSIQRVLNPQERYKRLNSQAKAVIAALDEEIEFSNGDEFLAQLAVLLEHGIPGAIPHEIRRVQKELNPQGEAFYSREVTPASSAALEKALKAPMLKEAVEVLGIDASELGKIPVIILESILEGRPLGEAEIRLIGVYRPEDVDPSSVSVPFTESMGPIKLLVAGGVVALSGPIGILVNTGFGLGLSPQAMVAPYALAAGLLGIGTLRGFVNKAVRETPALLDKARSVAGWTMERQSTAIYKQQAAQLNRSKEKLATTQGGRFQWNILRIWLKYRTNRTLSEDEKGVLIALQKINKSGPWLVSFNEWAKGKEPLSMEMNPADFKQILEQFLTYRQVEAEYPMTVQSTSASIPNSSPARRSPQSQGVES